MSRIPYYRQQKPYTCGPAVLRMALAFHGWRYTEDYLARLAETRATTGTSSFGMMRCLRNLGVPYTTGYRIRYRDLSRIVRQGPVIIDWMPQLLFPDHPEFVHSKEYNPEEDSHYALVIAASTYYVTLQDPVLGRRVRISRKDFVRAWRDPTSASNHWMLMVLPPHEHTDED